MTTLHPDERGAFAVREAERGDLLAIHRIERTSFPQPWPYAAFERYLGEEGFLVSVQRHESGREGQVVGYVVADTVPNHGSALGHVKDIAVDEEYRGLGLGTTLLEESMDILREAGADAMKLEVRASNARAINLYESNAFVHRRTIQDYYGNDEDALVLVHQFE